MKNSPLSSKNVIKDRVTAIKSRQTSERKNENLIGGDRSFTPMQDAQNIEIDRGSPES